MSPISCYYGYANGGKSGPLLRQASWNEGIDCPKKPGPSGAPWGRGGCKWLRSLSLLLQLLMWEPACWARALLGELSSAQTWLDWSPVQPTRTSLSVS